MRVGVRGVIYESAHEAARALGVSINTVYGAIKRGRTDTLGMGQGFRGGAGATGGRNRIPLILGRVHFDSLREADRAIGGSRGYVSGVLRAGGSLARARLARRIMEHQARVEAAERAARLAADADPLGGAA